jgi:hypothetical protein
MQRIKYLIFLLAFFAASCSSPEIEVGGITEINVSELSFTQVKGSVGIEIESKSLLTYTIDSSDLEVWFDNSKLGKIILLEPLEIKGNTKQTYNVSFVLKPENIKAAVTIIPKVLKGQQPKIAIKGTVQAKTLFLKKKIKFESLISK